MFEKCLVAIWRCLGVGVMVSSAGLSSAYPKFLGSGRANRGARVHAYTRSVPLYNPLPLADLMTIYDTHHPDDILKARIETMGVEEHLLKMETGGIRNLNNVRD